MVRDKQAPRKDPQKTYFVQEEAVATAAGSVRRYASAEWLANVMTDEVAKTFFGVVDAVSSRVASPRVASRFSFPFKRVFPASMKSFNHF